MNTISCEKTIKLFTEKPANAIVYSYDANSPKFYFDAEDWAAEVNSVVKNKDTRLHYSNAIDSMITEYGMIYESKIIWEDEHHIYNHTMEVAENLMSKGHFYFEYQDGTSVSEVVSYKKVDPKAGKLRVIEDKSKDHVLRFIKLSDSKKTEPNSGHF